MATSAVTHARMKLKKTSIFSTGIIASLHLGPPRGPSALHLRAIAKVASPTSNKTMRKCDARRWQERHLFTVSELEQEGRVTLSQCSENMDIKALNLSLIALHNLRMMKKAQGVLT